MPKQYIEKLLTVLECPIKNLADVDMPNKAELAVRFVAQAAECLFSQYPVSMVYSVCLQIGRNNKLAKTTFNITLLEIPSKFHVL